MKPFNDFILNDLGELANWIDIRDDERSNFHNRFLEFSGYSGVKEEYISILTNLPMGQFYSLFVDMEIKLNKLICYTKVTVD